jgi:Mu-like prophage major head subunit gpT
VIDMTLILTFLLALAAGGALVTGRIRAQRKPRTPLDDVLKLAKIERRRWRPMQLALRLSGVPLNDVTIPENWPKLLLPGLRMIWHTTLRDRSELYQGDAIFNIDSSQRASENYAGIGAIGTDGWDQFEKIRRVPYGGFDPNFEQTLKHKTFAKGLMVLRELLEDNLYPQAGIPKDLTQQVVALADSAALFREKAAADTFNNAFTDSGLDSAGWSVAGPDGVGLVSTAHPLSPSNTSTTQSNEFTLPLTAANLTTVKNSMRRWTDDKGDIVAVHPDTLIVPVALEDQANLINNTEFVIGSANNDRNPHYNKWNVIVWPFLKDDDAWFVVDSRLMKQFLVWLDRVKPEWQATEDFDTIMAKYRGYMRFSRGWITWQWVAGSNAS